LIPLILAAFFAAAPCTPSLGVDLTDISHQHRRTRNIPSYVAGALVRVVWAGGPAGRAGVNAGDVIQGVGRDLVQNVCDVRRAVAKQECGDVRLTIRRGKDTLALDVGLRDFPRRKKADTCEGGDGAACTALAKAHSDDIVLLRQACDLGDGEGCFMLGLKLGNTPEGGAAYEQACDDGNPLACTNLGWMAQNGAGMRADLDAAVRLYKRGCDGSACSGRNNLGCVNLGRLYRDGIGVTQDERRAITLFREVCDRGDEARACSLAGTTLLFGKNVEHNVAQSLALLEKGCNGGDAFGCFNLGAVYESGDDVPKDTARAAAYYQRACDHSDAEGCQRRDLLKWASPKK
jgi:TPR repeat protein